MLTRCWRRGGGTNTKRCGLICSTFGTVDMSYAQNMYIIWYIHICVSKYRYIHIHTHNIHILCVWHIDVASTPRLYLDTQICMYLTYIICMYLTYIICMYLNTDAMLMPRPPDASISQLYSDTHTSCVYDMATLPNLLHIKPHRSAARCRGRIQFPSNFAENRHHEIHAGWGGGAACRDMYVDMYVDIVHIWDMTHYVDMSTYMST